ncbi:hypothetical protein C8F04DRAFT_1402995 [Mycena alexandri]|uniref:Uncharacterized protein n=1 Tax=Mycena alexandri TaxID=1745969 RepID=A0AAD6WNT9_9AGAR|nr:hypothetical protein C8F04DRAFT_1402995 [Mycena alexandri]
MSDVGDNDMAVGDSQYTGNHDDNPESQYNNGKGVRYHVSLVPLAPPLKKGEKRRKNKKVETINRTIYVHEEESLADVLEAAIKAIDYDGKLLFKVVAKDLHASNFTIKWSITHTDFKNMQLTTTDHFDEMLSEAVLKATPAVKLDFVEFELEEDKNDSDDEPSTSKKRKLTDEEELMAEMISQLKAAYNCSDKRCTSPTCYLGNANGDHVCLTPIHLNTWASAKLAGIEGVDFEHPPADRMFQPVEGADDVDDIALLARRRTQANQANKSTTPSITINNDFAGLAQLFRPDHAATALAPTHQPAPTPRIPSPVKPLQMSFAAFCLAANLPIDISAKLEILEIAGPHLLEFIENSVLDQYLSVRNCAALRYAESQWKKGLIG